MGRGVQEGGIINFMSIRLQESKGHKIVKLQEGGTKTTSGITNSRLDLSMLSPTLLFCN